MTLNYINRQLSDEEFFTKVFNKGKSKSSEKLTCAAINNLQYFTVDKYQKSKELVLKDLKKEFDDSKETTLVLRFLQDFIDWLDENHENARYRTHPNDIKGRPIIRKDPDAIRSYVGRVRRYLKLCIGIKIDDDDYQDYLVFPADDTEDEEAEPLLKEELMLFH